MKNNNQEIKYIYLVKISYVFVMLTSTVLSFTRRIRY